MADFSLFTFVDGASVLYLAEGPKSFEELKGQKVGVRRGTTTEEALNVTLQELALDAEVVDVADHADGLNKLETKEIQRDFLISTGSTQRPHVNARSFSWLDGWTARTTWCPRSFIPMTS